MDRAKSSRFVPKKPQIKLTKRSASAAGNDAAPPSGPDDSESNPRTMSSPSISRFMKKSAPSGGISAPSSDGGRLTGRSSSESAATSGLSPRSMSRKNSGGGSAQPFETSDGAMRLNRILDSTPGTKSGVGIGAGGGAGMMSPPPPASISPYAPDGSKRLSSSVSSPRTGQPGARPASSSALPSTSAPDASTSNRKRAAQALDYIPPSTVQLADPTDENAVGGMACRITPKLRVDPRSIGGRLCGGDGKVEARTGNVVLRENWNSGGDGEGEDANKDGEDGAESRPRATGQVNRLTNECLFAMCISQFDLSVGLSSTAGGKKRHIPIAKSRNKLRYAVILRSTNRPLLRPAAFAPDGNSGAAVVDGYEDEDDEDDTVGNDLSADDNYDHLYNPDPRSDASASTAEKRRTKRRKSKTDQTSSEDANKKANAAGGGAAKRPEYDSGVPSRHEISSFPALHCMAIHSDGTKPDVRKVLELDKLVSIENCPPKKGSAASGSAGTVALVFRNGDAVEIDCDLPNAVLHSTTGGSGSNNPAAHAALGKGSGGMERTNKLRKERFLWSLLQVHAMLCTAVAERAAAEAAQAGGGGGRTVGGGVGGALPPLKVRNVDRGELQVRPVMKESKKLMKR